MRFVVSSPDSLLFDRTDFTRGRSRTEQVVVSLLALLVIGMQIATFVMVHKLMATGTL